MEKIKIIIADDDALIRESLKIILNIDEEIEVLEIFENGLKAVEYIEKNEVDLAILDVRMPILNGVDATKQIKKVSKTKVIILTTFDEDDYIKAGIKNGANGYLLKSTEPKKIIDSIKLVYAGNSVFQQEILEKFSKDVLDRKKEVDLDIFTEREIDVIREIRNGFSNKDISKNLFISEGTVKNYITSILQKTGLEHRTQIAIKYIDIV